MWRGLLSLLILILIWQVLVMAFHLPVYILPSPYEVLQALIVHASLIMANAIPTVVETLTGLLLGILLGAIIALALAQVVIIRYWLLPIIIAGQAIPTFAIAPLLVLWFGYGMTSKIITVMLMLFFPVASAFYEGLTRTKSEWLDMAKIMQGKNYLVLWHLRIPHALPNLAVGIKVATALAPIGAVISEWVGASKGLGFLMLNASARLEIPLMFACIAVITLFSLSLYGIVNKVLATTIKW